MNRKENMRAESGPNREPLSRDEIWAANHSMLAGRLRDQWDTSGTKGTHTLIDACADARLAYTRFLADPSVNGGLNPSVERMRYIAAAGFTSRFLGIANDPANGELLVSTHHKCGGQGERAKAEAGKSGLGNVGIGFVVHTKIISSNPYVQALSTAEQLSHHVPDKPVYAAVTDHETGSVKVFSRWESNRCTAGYNNIKAEAGDEPEALAEHFLTDELARKLSNNKKFVEIIGSDPDYQRNQQTQNPQVVTITTDRRPKSLTTPGIVDFTLSLPFNGGPDGQRNVTIEDIYEVFSQAQYPLTHATHAKPGESFFATSTLVIESPLLTTSQALAGTLVQERWVVQWLQSAKRCIYVAQISEGRMSNLQVFDFK